MPYITKEQRYQLDDYSPSNAGELNYVITQICREFFERNGGRYQQINDIMGALEGAKLEFYRRLVAPYEDRKAKENGDVYVA